MRCFICTSTHLFKFLDLGAQPPSDAFVRKEDVEKPEPRYPLELYLCETCLLVQLGFVADPKELFTKYVYTTGMNNQLREHFKTLVHTLVHRFTLGKDDLAVDIGSNDGTLLAHYIPHGVRILGIDPSSAGELARTSGIPTETDFFDEDTALRVVKKYGKAKVITATNVFAHVAELASFMRGITQLLTPRGVFVSESGYLLDMIETGGYDAVYHEHMRYYSLRPLLRLFEQHGLEVFRVERTPSHNGSIRVFAAHKAVYPVEDSVAELIETETKAGLYERSTYEQFAKDVQKHSEKLHTLLRTIHEKGERVVGIGAPAKGNTLLNSCTVTPELVYALLEKSEHKIGLFAPGSHIPVVSEELLFREQPEYALMLSWNLADELIAKLRSRGYRGTFIIPFPTIRTV